MKNKILACLDNNTGLNVLEYLINDKDSEVVFVITHPEMCGIKYNGIYELCQKNSIQCIDIIKVRENFDLYFSELSVDYLVSIYFDYILDERFLNLPYVEAINLHPGYLPYNKGFYYYVWALLEGTPAGVSIHRMTEDVDDGHIISQKRVIIENTDTGDIIYQKHENEAFKLFQATWPNIKIGNYKTYQQQHVGTHKKLKDFHTLRQIDPFKEYKAIDLINQIRVLSHENIIGSKIFLNGQEYSIKLKLEKINKTKNDVIPGGKRIN
jgi:methionyl-tRNA formyltransferase